MHKTVGALTLAALRPYLAGGFAFVVGVLHPLYATQGDKKYPEAGWTAKRGYLSLGASNGPGARGRELRLEVKMGTTWTSFGSPAASAPERPVALRPRLAAGLPLSWTHALYT